MFQSTPPCGGRQCEFSWCGATFSTCFNPRPRAGGDRQIQQQLNQAGYRGTVSIHAPVRGATAS